MKAASRNSKFEIRGSKETRVPKLESDAGGARISNFELPSDFEPRVSDFSLWQLADSAFPTGGFAHSNGLEAAWQHGEVPDRAALVSFLEAGLHQAGRAALPFVTAAHGEPERLGDFDQLCDAFTTNHVANRASRAQGRAFLTAVERIFPERGQVRPREASGMRGCADQAVRAPYAHLAPVFGACLGRLGAARDITMRMFCFNHLRGTLAAAVRLNIVGPMEAQVLQRRLVPVMEATLTRCGSLTPEDLAQTSPLLDLWQGAQDRLYSRLFQS
jgi:urease accessory protein